MHYVEELYKVYAVITTHPVTDAELAPYPVRFLQCLPLLSDLDSNRMVYLVMLSARANLIGTSDPVFTMFNTGLWRNDPKKRCVTVSYAGYYYDAQPEA